jgi:D-glycero-D-manno-heptose 1,7-bisphosphate phosphatase
MVGFNATFCTTSVVGFEFSRETSSALFQIAFRRERPTVPTPAIFLDRDGVINCRRPDDYVLNFAQFFFTPGIKAALQQLATLGLPMIVVSNQACVGKGLLDLPMLQQITVEMHQNLAAEGIFVTAAYYCIHRSDDNCLCRKPKPGLLYRATDAYNIALRRSIFIGDSETDIQAGLAAGCKPIFFGSDQPNNTDFGLASREIPVARVPEELFLVSSRCLKDCADS